MTPIFVPHLHLFRDHAVVEGTGAFESTAAALARLVFDYGGTRVAMSDDREVFYRSTPDGLTAIRRDRQAEHAACACLESFGAVEIACLHDVAVEDAHYLIDTDGDVDALTNFGALALPALEAQGWVITIADDYPVHVVRDEPHWHVKLGADSTGEDADDAKGWFTLELGIEVGGERISILPFVIERLESGNWDLDSLARCSRPFVSVPLGDNRYLPVEPERLRRVLMVLIELYDAEPGAQRLHLPSPRFAGVTELEQVLGEVTWDDPGERRRSRGTPSPRAPAADGLRGDGVRATLRPYQNDGVRWLRSLRERELGGILADDMGLGKTLQTIAYLTAAYRDEPVAPASLIVAPTSLIGNWRRELERFAPHLRVLSWYGGRRHQSAPRLDGVHVVLTTYGVLTRDIDLLAERDFHTLVLDEAQAIKNPQSHAHGAALRVAAAHRVCLTGTPIENHLGELWALMDFLNPGLLGSRMSFRHTFADPIEKHGSVGRLEALRKRVAPCILRRLKTEVAPELPAKTEMLRHVELTGPQRDLYESIRLSAHEEVRYVIRERGLSHCAIDLLGALLKLRQVCCDPRLVHMEAAQAVTRSAKRELLCSMLAEMIPQGRRVLIFSQFTTMLAILSASLRERGMEHVILTGDTQNRDRPVATFQAGEVPIFLLSLKAGGTGLNLTAADTVIHYDPWWNPAIQAQATDRAYRIGQDKPVFVYNLIAAGSVEARILALQRRKRGLADQILGASASLSDISQSDIDDLFAPLDGSVGAGAAGAGAAGAPAVSEAATARVHHRVMDA